jgi:hypothetical protein
LAYQSHKKPQGGKILRTPAPDEITNIRNPGMFSAGTNGPQPSALPPGQASESILATNMRESLDTDDLTQVVKQGTAGRGDEIPSEMPDDFQRRRVSAEMYPAVHGAKRQQMDLNDIGRAALPEKQTDNEKPSVRKPV